MMAAAPMMGARPGMPPQAMPMQAQSGPTGVAGVRANYKYTSGVRNATGQVVSVTPQQVIAQPPQPQPAVFIQGQEPLTASMLAAAPPNEQKQMLGERLFPLIQQMHPMHYHQSRHHSSTVDLLFRYYLVVLPKM